jgi:hypothetical protein
MSSLISKFPPSLFNFEKLSESNWQTWKPRMIVAFRLMGVLNLVIQSPTSTETSTGSTLTRPKAEPSSKDELPQNKSTSSNAGAGSAPSQVATEADISLALGLIQLMVDDSQMRHVLDAQSPSQAWARLCEVHEDASLASEMALLMVLFRTKMVPGQSMQSHINNIRDIQAKLVAINASLPSEILAKYLIASVPYDAYKHVTITLKKPLDIHQVSAALLAEEMRINLAGSKDSTPKLSESGSSSALVASGYSKPTDVPKSSVTCNYCHRTGHIEKYCGLKKSRTRRPDANRAVDSSRPVFNQSAAKEPKESNKPTSTAAAVLDDDSDALVFIAASAHAATQEPVDTGDQVFFIDSGASEHYTSSLESLHEYTPVHPPLRVTVGNGAQAEAIGSGSVKANVLVNNKWR